uniref:Glycoprotein n=1 Tax=Phasivirus wutaiense TaxID=3052633 RepID=A0A6C0X4L3_9VIRU|nr:glycoprotein precursor [Phasivirus wutaiense]
MNITLFVVSFSLCFSIMEINGARKLNIQINDLDRLETSLRDQGASETLVRTIYAAANCDLKRNKILDEKIDKILSPMENLHQKVNEALNSLIKRSSSMTEPLDTVNIMINVGSDLEQDVADAEVFSNRAVTSRGSQMNNVALSSYAPMNTRELTVNTEVCKTVKSMEALSQMANTKRAELLSIAGKVYGYKGGNSISELARFYIDYVSDNYDLQNQVMGLAKLLGDYASTTSEHFMLDNSIVSHKEPCGFLESNGRKKRNVQASKLTGGKCIRNVGDQASKFSDTICFSQNPHLKSINYDLFSEASGSCDNPTTFENGVFEKENSIVVIAVGMENGKPCLNWDSCENGHVITDGKKCVEKANGTCSQNVDNLRISIISGRFRASDIPDDLKLISKHYCSISGHVFDSSNSCSKPVKYSQKFTLFLLEKTWYMTDKEVLIAHGQDVTNLCFYDCTGCTSDCTKCKGDETYINNFGNWPTSTCKCSYCHDCSELFIQIEDSKFGVDSTFTVDWVVGIPVTEEKEIECTSCKATCSGFTIKIERDMKFDILHLCVEKNCEIISQSQPDFSYTIPNKFMHSASFIVHFFRSDGKGKKVLNLSCSNSHTCEAISCDVCIARFANPHCYKFVNWVILITGVSGLVLTVPLLFSLYSLAKLLLSIILIPARGVYKIGKLLLRICYKKTNNKVKETTKRVTSLLQDEGLNEVKIVKSKSRAATMLFIIALTMIPLTSCCENSVTLMSKSEDCVTTASGKMKCSVSSVTDIPLSSLGEESCLRITDPMGQLSQLVKIKTKSLRQKCSKNILYYTTEPEFKLHNTFRCRNAGNCVNDACEKVKSTDSLPVDSADDKKAGVSGCLRVTGFWGKGCFYMDQACQFYKVELDNSKRISYEIFDCKEWFWEIIVDISIESHSINETESKELLASVPVKTSLGSAQLVTVVSPVTTSLNSCFARREVAAGKIAMISCSPQSKFLGRTTGSIQCATSSLASAASKSCLIDSNQMQIIPQDDNLVLVNNFVNVTEDWMRGILPTNFSTSVVSEDGAGSVLIQYTGRAAYTLRLKIKDYKVEHVISRPKCEAHFRKLTGCSNCGSGSEAIIEVITSPPSKTPGTLSCPSAVASSSALINSASPKTKFKMAFRQPEVNEICYLECGVSNLTLQVEGRLLQVVDLQEPEAKRILGKYYDYFASLPWSYFGALRYFYLFIGTLIVVPLLVIVYKAIKGLFNFAFGRRRVRASHPKRI